MGYGNWDARRAGKDNGVCEDYNGVVSKVLGDGWLNPRILSVQSLEAHQRLMNRFAHVSLTGFLQISAAQSVIAESMSGRPRRPISLVHATRTSSCSSVRTCWNLWAFLHVCRPWKQSWGVEQGTSKFCAAWWRDKQGWPFSLTPDVHTAHIANLISSSWLGGNGSWAKQDCVAMMNKYLQQNRESPSWMFEWPAKLDHL